MIMYRGWVVNELDDNQYVAKKRNSKIIGTLDQIKQEVNRIELSKLESSKKKVMISQGMKDKSDEQILLERQPIINYLEDQGYEILDTVFNFNDQLLNSNNVVNKSVYYLSKSIEIMSQCNTIYFMKDWESYRGCVIEHEIAMKYGLNIIYED